VRTKRIVLYFEPNSIFKFKNWLQLKKPSEMFLSSDFFFPEDSDKGGRAESLPRGGFERKRGSH
jgi:hypothetical protein